MQVQLRCLPDMQANGKVGLKNQNQNFQRWEPKISVDLKLYLQCTIVAVSKQLTHQCYKSLIVHDSILAWRKG